jgi:hypothetical protein
LEREKLHVLDINRKRIAAQINLLSFSHSLSLSLSLSQLEREKIRVLDINRKRMAAQITIENKLQKLEDKYKQQVCYVCVEQSLKRASIKPS